MMLSIVSRLTDLAAPWASVYNDSKVISTAVTFAHLGGLLLAGGFALATDRATLRFVPSSPISEQALLTELHGIHRPVLLGLAVTFFSGILLLAADIESLFPALLFWIKMAVIAALLLNGALLRRAETELRVGSADPERAWRQLRRSAWVSVTLWFGALLLGTALLAI